MNLTFEQKALRWALSAALLSLGSAWLAAIPIRVITNSHSTITTQSSSNSSPEITISPLLLGQGREFFSQSCSHCHADDATGDEGPNLHNLTISNARIATTIKKGIKGEMPPFGKKYDDHQIAALVSYLRSLR